MQIYTGYSILASQVRLIPSWHEWSIDPQLPTVIRELRYEPESIPSRWDQLCKQSIYISDSDPDARMVAFANEPTQSAIPVEIHRGPAHDYGDALAHPVRIANPNTLPAELRSRYSVTERSVDTHGSAASGCLLAVLGAAPLAIRVAVALSTRRR
jgi:hypothetical protein